MNTLKVLNFDRPPINEVVFGVEFDSDSFESVHFGLFWEAIKARYPQTSTQVPILTQAKIAAHNASEHALLPRAWFETADQKKLIQLQEDRFHFNWRHLSSDDKYPQFKNLLPEFRTEWKSFNDWAKTNPKPVTVSPVKLELSYINHLDHRSGWASPKDNHKILTFLGVDRLPESFLTTGASAAFQISLGKVGDLSITAKQGLRKNDNQPVLVLDLTVKKRLEGESIDGWFMSAHDAILESFFSLTTPEAHKVWGFVKPGDAK